MLLSFSGNEPYWPPKLQFDASVLYPLHIRNTQSSFKANRENLWSWNMAIKRSLMQVPVIEGKTLKALLGSFRRIRSMVCMCLSTCDCPILEGFL